jgi:hypothetical protein
MSRDGESVGRFDTLNVGLSESTRMKRLIIDGDPGIRKDAIIDYDGEEVHCFSVTRNGDWHGPERVQLWCIVGSEDEHDDFMRRNFIPHHLEVDRIEAEAVDVIKGKSELSV